MKRIRMTGKSKKVNGQRHVDLHFQTAKRMFEKKPDEAIHYVSAFVPRGEGACGILLRGLLHPARTTTVLGSTTCATCIAAAKLNDQIEACAQAYRLIALMPLEVRSQAQSLVSRERAALIGADQ